MKKILMFGLICLALAGCSDRYKGPFGWPSSHWKGQNFKPYIANQQESQPNAYAPIDWSYPEGTDTAEILKRWKNAELVMQVQSRWSGMGRTMVAQTSKEPALSVIVGPGFYRLSLSSQQGLAREIDKMYKVTDTRKGMFLLFDNRTRQPIGTYNKINGLMLY